jgi:hypothetical protein
MMQYRTVNAFNLNFAVKFFITKIPENPIEINGISLRNDFAVQDLLELLSENTIAEITHRLLEDLSDE